MTIMFGWLSNSEHHSKNNLQRTQNLFDPMPTEKSVNTPLFGAILTKKTQRTVDNCVSDGIAVSVIGQIQWNISDIQSELQSNGIAYSILYAYRKYGTEKLFQHIGGHFSFSLIDNNEMLTILAIDKLGTNSICYTLTENGDFVFSSDLVTLKLHPGINQTLNLQAIYNYLYFHVIPSPITIYNNVYKLEPAQYIVFHKREISKQYYWKPLFSTSTNNTEDQLKAELHSTLENSVRNCAENNNAGAFLSGGLDSSTISGMLAKISKPNCASTFSIGFNEPGYDEIEYARIASKTFNTIQHEYYVTPADITGALVEIARNYDEPYGNSSAIPALFCARLAKTHDVGTLLAGDGGDELFAGNTRYAKQKLFSHYDKIPTTIKSLILQPLFLNKIAFNIPVLKKISSYIQQARLPMPKRMESYNFLNRIDISNMFTQEFLDIIDPNNPVHMLENTYNRCTSNNIVDKMLYLDWKFTLADNDIKKVNVMCDIAGVDVKYPMLDDDVIDFSTRVPAKLKLKGQKLRYFYKKSMEGFLPDKILHKKKHGFGLPFGEWLRQSEELQQIIYSALTDFSRRSIIKPEYITKIIQLHKSEHAAYYGTTVWVIAMLELWLKEHGF